MTVLVLRHSLVHVWLSFSTVERDYPNLNADIFTVTDKHIPDLYLAPFDT